MSKVEIINDDTFDESIRKTKDLIVVLFWAPWCGHCSGLIPILEQLSYELTNVNFISINKDEGLSIAEKFGIGSIPSFLFFKNGEVVDNILGRVKKEQLEDRINKILIKDRVKLESGVVFTLSDS